jgi:hypothetical protein
MSGATAHRLRSNDRLTDDWIRLNDHNLIASAKIGSMGDERINQTQCGIRKAIQYKLHPDRGQHQPK